jgi:lactoylglutathione lyase
VTKLLVDIDVDDLEQAVDFYTRAFGLRMGRRFGQAAAELMGLEAPIYLLAKNPGTRPFAGGALQRNYERHWTPVHLDFAVDDLEVAIRRAEAVGARWEGEIREHPWGRMALLGDPFGHGVCLLQFTGRGYDEVATG